MSAQLARYRGLRPIQDQWRADGRVLQAHQAIPVESPRRTHPDNSQILRFWRGDVERVLAMGKVYQPGQSQLTSLIFNSYIAILCLVNKDK